MTSQGLVKGPDAPMELHTSWRLSEDQKKQLQGVNRSGKWSHDEKTLLRTNIDTYKKTNGIEDIQKFLNQKQGRGSAKQSFYMTVAKGLNRPVGSVYRQVQRLVGHKNKNKPYTKEDLDKLANLQKTLGNNWKEIGAKLDRDPESVRDRFKVMNGNRGKWTDDEEKKLIELVYSNTNTKPGTRIIEKIPWKKISQMMVSRNGAQCMQKWFNELEWQQCASEKWTWQDSALLVDAIQKTGIIHEADIQWREVASNFEGVYRGGWVLKTKWNNLKKKFNLAGEAMQCQDMVNKIQSSMKPLLHP